MRCVPSSARYLLPTMLGALAMGASACAEAPPQSAVTKAADTAGCLATGDGLLEAEVRGALVADLHWSNAQMKCDGNLRDDGALRVTIAGPLPPAALPEPAADGGQTQLRFIFGIDPHDTASGVAQAFPVNLTVIIEGEQQLYATRGTDKCAAESILREPLPGNDSLARIKVRGYCVGPASDIAGTRRVLVPTFSFTAQMRNGVDP